MPTCHSASAKMASNEHYVVVFAYHRFASVADSTMTIPTQIFDMPLSAVEGADYSTVPLPAIAEWRDCKPVALPARTVAITVGDGYRSVGDRLCVTPRHRNIHVTLFVYPSAISNAHCAMTWPQLCELDGTGQADVQSHTYWHPKHRAKRLHRGADSLVTFALVQMRRAKAPIGTQIRAPVRVQVWPFGIHLAQLERIARKQSYAAAFTLDAHPLVPGQPAIVLRRCLVTDDCEQRCIASIFITSESDHD